MDIKTNKELNTFRGFTLIELLAVIVVLAIIILIALQSVLPQISKARNSAFAIEANSAIQSAQAYFMSNELSEYGAGLPTGIGNIKCVTIQQLIDSGDSELDSNYEGKVVVKKTAENKFAYYIWLYNHKLSKMIIPTSFGDSTVDVTVENVDDYVEGDWTKADTTYGNGGATCPNP